MRNDPTHKHTHTHKRLHTHTHTHARTHARTLTVELVVDEVAVAGVVAPPEEPELAAARPLAPAPHAQHVRLQAVAEAAQDGVLLRHREEDGCRVGALPHVPPPFDARQVRLREGGESRRQPQVVVELYPGSACRETFTSCPLHRPSTDDGRRG